MAPQSTLVFALAAMLSWGVGDFLIQRATRKVGDLEALTYIGIIGSILLLPFALRDLRLLTDIPVLLMMVLLGIITFVAALFDLEALKEGKLSIVDVVLELELPVTIGLGIVFFSDRLSVLQWTIIAVAFAGMLLIATRSFAHWRVRLERGVLMALVAAALMGVVNFLTAASAKAASPLFAVFVPWVVFTTICLAAISRRKGFSHFLSDGRRYLWLLLVMGLVDTVAWIFYANATFAGEISIITAITESYPAVALALGLLINKEKIRWYQILGAVLALGASAALCLTL